MRYPWSLCNKWIRKGGKKIKKSDKENIIESTKKVMAESDAVFLLDYRGLKVGDLVGLRRSLRDVSSEFRVVKNTLARIAFRDSEFQSLLETLQGPTAVAFSKADPVATARILTEFADHHPGLVLKGGALPQRAMSVREITALSRLPGIEILRAKMLGLLKTPAARLATLAVTPATQLARLLKLRGDQVNAA